LAGFRPMRFLHWPSAVTAPCSSAGRAPVSRGASPRAMPRKSIVTRTGDAGQTGLLYGGRVSKADPRTEAYGTIDEAISALGAARALVTDRSRHAIILRLQSELFTVGAELATDASEAQTLEKHFLTVTADFTGRVEKEINDLEAAFPLPDAFVIPGGTVSAAALDVARTVLRRAERRIVALHAGNIPVSPELMRYVNRLSDLVFMLARAEEGAAVRPLSGRRAARSPAGRARTRPAPRRLPPG
jgi:cob(I)alamin adenosyltransferase